MIPLSIFVSFFFFFLSLPCQIATRRAYGLALAKLGKASQRVVAFDGDTKNSTFSELFKKAFPERYIECFIAEQNMVHNISFISNFSLDMVPSLF